VVGIRDRTISDDFWVSLHESVKKSLEKLIDGQICSTFLVCLFVVIKPENLNPYFASHPGLEDKLLGVYSLGPRSSSCVFSRAIFPTFRSKGRSCLSIEFEFISTNRISRSQSNQ